LDLMASWLVQPTDLFLAFFQLSLASCLDYI
jgi:hypothetical protein